MSTLHHAIPAGQLEEVAAMLRRRTPRPEARREVRVSSPPVRTCYEQLIQVAGPREAVLDYAAHLVHEDRTTSEPRRRLLELESVDVGEHDTLTLLLSRAMYDG